MVNDNHEEEKDRLGKKKVDLCLDPPQKGEKPDLFLIFWRVMSLTANSWIWWWGWNWEGFRVVKPFLMGWGRVALGAPHAA
jgi:hypothetical protein